MSHSRAEQLAREFMVVAGPVFNQDRWEGAWESLRNGTFTKAGVRYKLAEEYGLEKREMLAHVDELLREVDKAIEEQGRPIPPSFTWGGIPVVEDARVRELGHDFLVIAKDWGLRLPCGCRVGYQEVCDRCQGVDGENPKPDVPKNTTNPKTVLGAGCFILYESGDQSHRENSGCRSN